MVVVVVVLKYNFSLMVFMLYRKILIKFCLYESLLSGADGGMI